jgi:hypothetical protein
VSEPQLPSTGGPDPAPPIAPQPVAAPAPPAPTQPAPTQPAPTQPAPVPQPSWTQAQPAPQQQVQAGWGQPAAVQPGWVQPAQVQAPGHFMFRVLLAALFMLAAGVLTLLPAAGFVLGGSKVSDYFNSEQFTNLGDTIGGALIAIGVVMLVWALLEILASLGMLLRRTWGRALGTVVGLFGGLFMTLILFGSLSALRAADTVGSTGVGGAALVAIVAVVFAGYWFTLLACITGGTHFRRG